MQERLSCLSSDERVGESARGRQRTRACPPRRLVAAAVLCGAECISSADGMAARAPDAKREAAPPARARTVHSRRPCLGRYDVTGRGQPSRRRTAYRISRLEAVSPPHAG